MKYTLLFLIGIILGCTPQRKEAQVEGKKIISAGGTVTEIIHELGYGDMVIATDRTSTYPPSMQALPSIGYRNQIKAEGMLALGPDLIIAEKDYLAAAVVEQLKSSGMEMAYFDKPKSVQGTFQLIDALAAHLNAEEKGASLAKKLQNDIDALTAYLATKQDAIKPTALFIMARGEDMVFVGGDDTFATEIIKMAGLQTPTLGFNDFVPLTPEALVSYNPDYILLFESGLATLGGKEGLAKIRGIEQTKAYQQGKILTYDGLLLSGFGPRVGLLALQIAKEVYE